MINQSILLMSRDTGTEICNTDPVKARFHYYSLLEYGEPGESIWVDNGRVGYNFEYADIHELYYRSHPHDDRPSRYLGKKLYYEPTASGLKILIVSKKHRTAVHAHIDFASKQINFASIFRSDNDFDYSLTFAEIGILHRLILDGETFAQAPDSQVYIEHQDKIRMIG